MINRYLWFTNEKFLFVSSSDDLIVVTCLSCITSVGFLYVFYSLNEYKVVYVRTNHLL